MVYLLMSSKKLPKKLIQEEVLLHYVLVVSAERADNYYCGFIFIIADVANRKKKSSWPIS